MPQINTDTDKGGYIYSDISHKIIGLSFRVFNNLKYGLQEKYYQRAFEEELKNEKINFKREQQIPIKYGDKIIGRYFVDFVVGDKIVVEFKVASGFYETHIKQVLAYLKTTNLKLGLLILITKEGIKCKRIIN